MAKEQGKQTDPKPRRRSRWVLFIIIALVIALAGLATWYFLYESQKNESQFGSRDVNALKGRVTMLSDEEILEELNQIVDENMFNISIASQVVVYGDPQIAELRIENKDINRYLMQVDIMLDEIQDEIPDEIDEEALQESWEEKKTAAPSVRPTMSPEERLVYRSLIIDPGYYIPTAELRAPMEPGEYSATAIFTAIYPDDETEVGKVSAKIMLFVLKQGEMPEPAPEPTPAPTPTPEPTPTPLPHDADADAEAEPSATPLSNP